MGWQLGWLDAWDGVFGRSMDRLAGSRFRPPGGRVESSKDELPPPQAHDVTGR